ncbi:hypothetical protein FRB99_001695, partial [Tulasnella sp. 403]
MSRVSDFLFSLFWSLVLYTLILINSLRFFSILLFGDLSVQVVPPPVSETSAQTPDSDSSGDAVHDLAPKDSDVVTSLLPCEPSPYQSSAVEDHNEAQTPHGTTHLAQTPPATTPPFGAAQQHPAQPSSPPHNAQALPINASGCYSEQEESPIDPSTGAFHGEGREGANLPRDEIPNQQPSFLNGSFRDDLLSVVPCWDLEHVIERSTCPAPSNPASSVRMHVALEVIQRAGKTLMMFAANNSPHSLHRALHLLDHIIPFRRHDPLFAVLLDLQAHLRYALFESTRNAFVLEQSINGFETLFGLPGWGTFDHGSTLGTCGMAFARRYGIRGDLKDLDRGIELLRGALEEMARNSGRRPSRVFMLGRLLLERHGKRRDDRDLNDEIDVLGEAVSLLAAEDPDRLVALGELGVSLLRRYEKSGNILDVEGAIAHLREALEHLSGNHPSLPSSLSNLARALIRRYQRLGNISDVEEAIVHLREALKHRSGSHPARPSILSNLASALITRYKRLGSISDVEEAIVHHREALKHLSGSHPDRPSILSNLASALITRYKRLGNISDVEEAIVHHREALKHLSGSHPARPSSLSNLANALITRYKRLGNISDVKEAIGHYREALEHLSGSHPARPSSLSNLANALITRYEKLGNISDVEDAIKSLEEASNASHPADPHQSTYFHNLANLLLSRMNDGDLNKAIDLYEKALSLRPDNHPDRPGTLESLGRVLLRRKRNASDIETGMRYIDEALSLSPSHSPDRQIVLLNYLVGRSEHVKTGKRYLDEADPSSLSPDEQTTLLSLARQLSRYTDKTVLRDRCIELAKLTPPEHVHYSVMTSFIAPILYACHDVASDLLTALGLDPSLNAEDATLDLLRKGSRSTSSPSTDQLDATCHWIIFSEMFDRPRNLEMYDLMLEHLDLAVACGSSLD